MSDVHFSARTLDAVATDYRHLLREKLPSVRSLVAGRQLIVEARISANGPNPHLAERWVCLAHEGTLDKLERLFVGEGQISDFEIVGGARNLFENLVWCRLFRADVAYGLVFYEQLLREQIESVEAHIAKIDSEIRLFAELESVEDSGMASLVDRLKRGEIDGARFSALFNETKGAVDSQARLAFAIYGPAAVYNGYGYQQHVLANSIKPKLEHDLQALKSELQSFESARPASSEVLMAKISQGRRVNWRRAAAEIGMRDEYDFVYSFASKMLHSKAISTVPNGQLSEGEAILMFEYAYVAATRMLDCLSAGAMPTVPDLSVIQVGDE